MQIKKNPIKDSYLSSSCAMCALNTVSAFDGSQPRKQVHDLDMLLLYLITAFFTILFTSYQPPWNVEYSY